MMDGVTLSFIPHSYENCTRALYYMWPIPETSGALDWTLKSAQLLTKVPQTHEADAAPSPRLESRTGSLTGDLPQVTRFWHTQFG